MSSPPTMDAAFKALADPTRRRLLDNLNVRNGQNLSELCEGVDMARQSVTKHLEILEAANLVVSVRRGRERLHYLNAAPIQEIADRWIDQYHHGRASALADLKNALEGQPVSTRTFVYKTYIKTTPEELWKGLTDPTFTKRYWNIDFATDWAPGSPMVWHHHGATIDDPDQVVVTADPFHRLSYTWHSFTPDLAERFGIDAETLAKLDAEPRTVVTFEIVEQGPVTELTVIHDGFEPGSTLVTMISEGWPRVIAALKTLLETGDVLEPVG
jgi:DNA-binding transcriptional ArsR family regulator/uncharacterized protein YndB with AHSA1/START domain